MNDVGRTIEAIEFIRGSDVTDKKVVEEWARSIPPTPMCCFGVTSLRVLHE